MGGWWWNDRLREKVKEWGIGEEGVNRGGGDGEMLSLVSR